MARSVLAKLSVLLLAWASASHAIDSAPGNTSTSPNPASTNQTVVKPPANKVVNPKSAASKPAAAKPEPKSPNWKQLTPQQQQLFAELAPQWDQQPDRLRNNLIKVANKYPKMKLDEQERVRRRITRWASLTPAQREAARERYKQIKKQPPEKQKEVKQKWEAFQTQQPSATAPVATPVVAPPDAPTLEPLKK